MSRQLKHKNPIKPFAVQDFYDLVSNLKFYYARATWNRMLFSGENGVVAINVTLVCYSSINHRVVKPFDIYAALVLENDFVMNNDFHSG